MNTTIEPAAIPGAAWGITIWRRIDQALPPRSYAASIKASSRLSSAFASGTTMNSNEVYTSPTRIVASR